MFCYGILSMVTMPGVGTWDGVWTPRRTCRFLQVLRFLHNISTEMSRSVPTIEVFVELL